jgi:hypothetical protein
MFKVSSDIYFVIDNLYYVDQNNDLGIRARPINRDGGSSCNVRAFIQEKNKEKQISSSPRN